MYFALLQILEITQGRYLRWNGEFLEKKNATKKLYRKFENLMASFILFKSSVK